MVEFVAKKSVWSVISFWRIVSCILIIPAIILIFKIVAAKKETITFYADKVVIKKGWLNTTEKTFVFVGVFSVDISQSLLGKIYNYGSLEVDFVGKYDINTTYIKDPKALKKYLESKIVEKTNVHTYVNN